MLGIIDFHAHAFPDKVAAGAVPALAKAGNVTACLDGRIDSLLTDMDRVGIDQSVLCSIATKPGQFKSILAWSKDIRSERIIPLPSFHPENPEALENIKIIKDEGFKGIKMHPYYQNFILDEERMLPLYELISEVGLILVMHTGFDIGFPRERICDPARISRVIKKFPQLKLVATHMGAWDMWDEVREMLIGQPLYMDISFSLQFLSRADARQMIMAHPNDRILFGTDSPWICQEEVIKQFRALELPPELEERIFSTNASTLLGN